MADTHPHTDPEYTDFADMLAACDWNDTGAVSELITGRHTPQAFREELVIKQFNAPGSDFSYLANFFGFEEFKDGKGKSLITEVYHKPVLDFGFQRWRQEKEDCELNPEDCFRCREELPEGGYSTQDIEMFSAGVRTKPYCIKNIRSIRDFDKWRRMILEDQMAFEKQIMLEFYLMAVMRTAGNKILLELDHPDAGASPRDLLDEFPMAYRDHYFPTVYDPEKIQPFDLALGEYLADNLIERGLDTGAAARGSRGPVFEFWTGSDWLRKNVFQNAEYAEKLKYTMPANLFAGMLGSADSGTREVYGNLAPRFMRHLPRFALSSEGGITIVQPHTRVNVEIGTEAISNPDWRHAPFEAFVVPSPNQAKILRPEPITTVDGISILPITGNGPWRARNPYDKECNPEENMPWWEKDFDLGLAPWMPDEGTLILGRRRKFNWAPVNHCDLEPIACVTPASFDCTVAAGCDTSDSNVSQSITRLEFGEEILCTSASCGDSTIYKVKYEHKDKREDFEFSCDCGDEVLAILDDDSEVYANIVETMPHPNRLLWVQTLDASGGDPAALEEGRCIVRILCPDATAGVGDVEGCADQDAPGCEEFENGELLVTLDNFISCGATDSVTVTYKDADGNTTSTDTGTIAEANPVTGQYRITGLAVDAPCTDASGGTVATVTCA